MGHISISKIELSYSVVVSQTVDQPRASCIVQPAHNYNLKAQNIMGSY